MVLSQYERKYVLAYVIFYKVNEFFNFFNERSNIYFEANAHKRF